MKIRIADAATQDIKDIRLWSVLRSQLKCDHGSYFNRDLTISVSTHTPPSELCLLRFDQLVPSQLAEVEPQE